MANPGAGKAAKIVLSQLGASVALAGLTLGGGLVFAYSMLIGGLIATLANGYFASRVFAPYRAQKPEKLVARFYGAELEKLVLTVLMVVGTLAWVHPLNIGALFGAYFVIQLVPILAARFS